MSQNYYIINEEILEEVPKMLNKTRNNLIEDVKILKKWFKAQPHFPEVIDDKRLENFIIQNKFSLERTKQKLDAYYSIRSRIDDIYEKIHPKYKNMQEIFNIIYYAPLPKLTEDYCRIFCFKVRDVSKTGLLEPINVIRTFINLAELQLIEDCWFLNIYIFDFKDLPISYLQKFVTYIPKLVSIFQSVYSLRIQHMYVLNPPPMMSTILSLLKRLLKPKVFARLEILEDPEMITNKISKEILPRDYNGEAETLEELNEKIKLKFIDYDRHFDNLDALTVSENLRPAKLHNNETLGFHGTFKKLNID